MYNRKAFSTAAALALAAGVLLVPAGTLARGAGGFAGGARGPIFGFHHARIAVHRPIGPALARRFPARFGFKSSLSRLYRFGRQRQDAGAISAVGDGLYGGYGTSYDPNATGAIAPGPAFAPLPPGAYPPDHVGCLARGYDVPSQDGGMTKVTVTRC